MATFTITDDTTGKSAQFAVKESTLGANVLDISPLYKEFGIYTYDNGLGVTGSCESAITYIDGAKGELLYRGYPIEELAQHKNYVEVIHLILTGELPTKEQYTVFEKDMRLKRFPHEGIKNIFKAFPDNAHPMAIISSAVSALSAFHHQHLNVLTNEEYLSMAQRIIAKMPTIAAYAYRHLMGYPIIFPDMDRYYTENFLYMMRAFPTGKTEIKDVEVRCMDAIFILHADHEQNASTTTVRAVGSTSAHPYAAIGAGINALWGKAHGGANEEVIEQLEMIGDPSNVEKFIARAKDPNDSFRLMGFGHRIYKNFDPRAQVLKKLRDELRDELGINSKLIEIANKIEEIALTDEYFIQRNLYPNIDFYSGTIFEALGIKKQMFTPIFVIGRTVGWVAQLMEQRRDPNARIIRPRQNYIGLTKRHIE